MKNEIYFVGLNMNIGKWHLFSINDSRQDRAARHKSGGTYRGALFAWRGFASYNGRDVLEAGVCTRPCFGIEVSLDPEENGLGIHLYLLLVSLSLRLPLLRSLLPNKPLEYGVEVHHGTLWIKIHSNPFEWNSSDPWWQQMHFGLEDAADLLFGKIESSERNIGDSVDLPLAMPEGVTYTIRAQRSVISHVRSRLPQWLYCRDYPRVDMDVIAPTERISFPGKGENGYDCDEDGIYSMSTAETDVYKALGSLASSVMRSRKRYGGSTRYIPEAFRPTESLDA